MVKFSLDTSSILGAAAAAAGKSKENKTVKLQPIRPNSELPQAPISPIPNHPSDVSPGLGSMAVAGGAGGLAAGTLAKHRPKIPRESRGSGSGSSAGGTLSLVAKAIGGLRMRLINTHIEELVTKGTLVTTADLVPPKSAKKDPLYSETIQVYITLKLDTATGVLSIKQPSCAQALGFHSNVFEATFRNGEAGVGKKQQKGVVVPDSTSAVSFGALEDEVPPEEKYSKYYDSDKDWLAVSTSGYLYYVVAQE